MHDLSEDEHSTRSARQRIGALIRKTAAARDLARRNLPGEPRIACQKYSRAAEGRKCPLCIARAKVQRAAPDRLLVIGQALQPTNSAGRWVRRARVEDALPGSVPRAREAGIGRSGGSRVSGPDWAAELFERFITKKITTHAILAICCKRHILNCRTP